MFVAETFVAKSGVRAEYPTLSIIDSRYFGSMSRWSTDTPDRP